MLRVISGIYKGIRLDEVPLDTTRPTTDRNKESLFNILGQYFEGGRALDLFSGSGSIGIESISRGVDSCAFVDHEFVAIKTIEQNLKKLKGLPANQFSLTRQDVLVYLNQENHPQYDYIFVDPPYALDIYDSLLRTIAQQHWLTPKGILIFESDKDRIIEEKMDSLVCVRISRSGNTAFHFYMWEDSV